ncbi:hypothetical protein Tco_0443900, partial [Tanacetum coccineum]
KGSLVVLVGTNVEACEGIGAIIDGDLGKQKKVSFIMSEKTRKPQRLELVHTEGYGPT